MQQIWARPHQNTTPRTHISSHASGAVTVPRISEDGKVEFLLIDYTDVERRERTKRCLMGKRDERNNRESPIETLKREMRHEALTDKNGEFLCEWVIPEKKVVLTDLVPDHEDPTGWHLKIFFLVMIQGVLRTENMTEEGLRPEILGPPKYYDAAEVLDKLVSCEWLSKDVHVRALKAGLFALAQSHPRVAARYSRTVDIYCNGFDRNTLKSIVCDYLRRFV